MPTVRVEPSGVIVEVRDGEALMSAALRSGYRWPSVCGGLAECGACVMEVLSADRDQLEPQGEAEALRLGTVPERRLRPEASLRLACQFRPGPTGAVVHKRGVRPCTELSQRRNCPPALQ